MDIPSLVPILLPIIEEMTKKGLNEEVVKLVDKIRLTPITSYQQIIDIVKEFVDIEEEK